MRRVRPVLRETGVRSVRRAAVAVTLSLQQRSGPTRVMVSGFSGVGGGGGRQ